MERKGILDVTSFQKNQIAQFLIGNSVDGVVNHGKVKEASDKYGKSRRTIHRIWAEARQKIIQGISVNLTSNKLGFPKKKKQIEIDLERMKLIPFQKRSTIRRLAKELQVNKSHVGRWVKSGVIKAHTNAIKPELTKINKFQRLNFSLNHLVVESDSQKIKFRDMFHVVHIDEKWFYMSRESKMYYMVPDETEPHRTCKSKRFIPKVMFMCAVCRPRSSSEGVLEFDGKIGIWPFTTKQPAQRNSKNRVKGTLVTKPIDSITKEVIKACMLNQIIPSIKAKWPPNASKNILIQQDNAKPHISNDDQDFRAAATSDGFNIHIICQPPNSPDTNVNDLGWFRAIQSLQVDTSSYNVDDLVKNVYLSFQNLTPITLNNVFLSLQSCLVEILKTEGNNNYKLPHMGKERLLRERRLPISLEVDEKLVKESIMILLGDGQRETLSYDIQGLLTDLDY